MCMCVFTCLISTFTHNVMSEVCHIYNHVHITNSICMFHSKKIQTHQLPAAYLIFSLAMSSSNSSSIARCLSVTVLKRKENKEERRNEVKGGSSFFCSIIGKQKYKYRTIASSNYSIPKATFSYLIGLKPSAQASETSFILLLQPIYPNTFCSQKYIL